MGVLQSGWDCSGKGARTEASWEDALWGKLKIGQGVCSSWLFSTHPITEFSPVGLAVWDLLRLVGNAVCLFPLMPCAPLSALRQSWSAVTLKQSVCCFQQLCALSSSSQTCPLLKSWCSFELILGLAQGESIPLFLTELFISFSFTLVLWEHFLPEDQHFWVL